MKTIMTGNTGENKKKENHVLGKPHCRECGFRIRGKVANHKNGLHHKHGRHVTDKTGNFISMNFN